MAVVHEERSAGMGGASFPAGPIDIPGGHFAHNLPRHSPTEQVEQQDTLVDIEVLTVDRD